MGFTKFFTKEILNSEVEGVSDEELFTLWKKRVSGWYLEPIEEWPITGHEAFVALMCVREVFHQVQSVAYGPLPFDAAIVAEEWLVRLEGLDDEANPPGRGPWRCPMILVLAAQERPRLLLRME